LLLLCHTPFAGAAIAVLTAPIYIPVDAVSRAGHEVAENPAPVLNPKPTAQNNIPPRKGRRRNLLLKTAYIWQIATKFLYFSWRFCAFLNKGSSKRPQNKIWPNKLRGEKSAFFLSSFPFDLFLITFLAVSLYEELKNTAFFFF
jgi:hypothetical protein